MHASNETRRIESLDQFRGFAISSMVLVNVLGRFSIMPDFLRHARYESLSFADAVAPFFFFVVGMGFRLSWMKTGSRVGAFQASVMALRRCVVLMILAVFIYHFDPKRIFWDALSQISFGCLLGLPVIGAGAFLRTALPFAYAAILIFLTGGQAQIFGVPLKIESASWPLMILMGSIAADWIKEDKYKLLYKTTICGSALTMLGLVVYFLIPKNIAACALVYLGCSFLLLGFFYYLSEIRHVSPPQLTTLGRNALVVYVLHYYLDDDMRRLIPNDAGLIQALLAFGLVFGACYTAARYLESRKVFITV